MVYCSKCGSKLAEGMSFCSNCGQKIDKATLQPKTETKELSNAGKAIGACIIIILVIIAIVFTYMLSQSIEEISNVGMLYIEIENHSDSTITYSYYIDGEYKGTGNLDVGYAVTLTHDVKEGTHTITVNVPGEPSQMKTEYVPKDGQVSVEFYFN